MRTFCLPGCDRWPVTHSGEVSRSSAQGVLTFPPHFQYQKGKQVAVIQSCILKKYSSPKQGFIFGLENGEGKIKTLPKAQRAQGIEYCDSFNTFSSKQKLQQALKSLSNFSLVLFGKRKGREIPRTTLTNLCNNLYKSL